MKKNNFIVGLDIGTSSIKALVARPKSQQGRLNEGSRSQKELEVLTQAEEPALGIRKGVVIDPDQVSLLIQAVLRKAQENLKQKINSVYVNVGGSHIFSTSSRGLVSVSRADQKISQEDIERVLAAAQTFSLPSHRQILEVLPREFIIDGEGGIKEPLGLQGVRLEAEVLVLAGFAPYIKNLTSAVLNAGLQINDLVLNPLASSLACLTPREKELGVLLLDIGAGTTDLAVFEEGDLIHLAILPLGSGHITNDIAIFLKSDIDLAERIKLEFGKLFFQGSDKKEKIKLSEEETLVFSQKQLSEIIEDRVLEIFEEVEKELKKISKHQLLPAGVVLTGGGARLPKIKELAKRELKLPCRIGRPQGFSPPLEDPRLATVCGLVLRGADLEREPQFSFPVKGIGAKIKRIFRIFIP